MSTRTKVVLTKLVVFSPNDLVDDRLCVLIPMLCPAAVTNPDGDFGTTKDIALIGTLAETDPLIASGDAATLAKIAAIYFTQPAQIRHAIVRSSLGTGLARAACASSPIIGVPVAQIGAPL